MIVTAWFFTSKNINITIWQLVTMVTGHMYTLANTDWPRLIYLAMYNNQILTIYDWKEKKVNQSTDSTGGSIVWV